MKENSMSEAMEEKTGTEASETGVKAADAGQEDTQGTEKQEKRKPGWDELMADPEYKSCFDSRVQEIVRKRLRDRHGSEETLGRLRPVLEALGEKYGLESTAWSRWRTRRRSATTSVCSFSTTPTPSTRTGTTGTTACPT